MDAQEAGETLYLMTAPDFSQYTLALLYRGRVVYSSNAQGLKPLRECIAECSVRFRECTLFDKVIGLAAAKLILYSGMVNTIITTVASRPAVDFLGESHIAIYADRVVDNILTKDGKAVCPGERIALETEDREQFLVAISSMLQERISTG